MTNEDGKVIEIKDGKTVCRRSRADSKEVT